MRRIVTGLIRTAACTATAIAATAIAAPSVATAAADPIGPGQSFVGLVNSATRNATLTVLCVGPLATGHPLRDTLTVTQIPTPSAGSGATGTATQVSADLTVPAANPPATRVFHLATFTTYGSQTLDPSLVLPCVPSGVVTFTPVAGGPAAQAATVDVRIVNPGF